MRGHGREWLGIVDDELDFSATARHLALGAWQVTVEAASPSADLLLEGEGLALIDADGRVLLSGPKRPMERGRDPGSDNTLTFTGVDDTALLSRIVYPSPATAITSTGTKHTAQYWTRNAPAETVLRDLISANAGTSALADRRVPGLYLPASQERGAALSSQLRLDNLLDAAWEIARTGGLGFHVVQDTESTDLHLVVYEPRDRSREIRFGEHLGNLGSYEYSATPPEVTDVIVAIGGEGVDRRFYRYQRRDPLWPGVVIEEVLDARDLSQEPGDGDEEWVNPDAASEQRATERLDDGAATASVTFEPLEVDGLRFGADYALGDIVTAELDLGDVTDTIREVRYSRTPDGGELIVPSIGEPPDQPQIYRRVAALRRDVDQLKTRR
ncbi:siphovirus ReqiPepy6 Gp37-like family protein [Nocardiopsis exhalans]|uniref:siphovirus ReqiPepy6 Gp37-like family protein n=1 Tax=Nocardiopsis exhalans TaxID=163604 RepID=UPI0031DC02D1